MPHYADGSPAQAGDRVKGNGYNESKTKEIVGEVVDVRPGESCTLSVAYIASEQVPEKLDPWQVSMYRDCVLLGSGANVRALRLKIEFGDTKGFSKIASA